MNVNGEHRTNQSSAQAESLDLGLLDVLDELDRSLQVQCK